jgi:hypothetical protein
MISSGPRVGCHVSPGHGPQYTCFYQNEEILISDWAARVFNRRVL